ncbi:MAG: HAMP domain-containing sensor histidine kinase [Chloroflexota bacterium]
MAVPLLVHRESRPRRAGSAPGTVLDQQAIEDLAHDLRSPLSALQGLLELVLHEPDSVLTPSQRHLLDCAVMAGGRLRTTIDRVIDTHLSPVTGDRNSASVGDSLAGVLPRLQSAAESRGVRLAMQVPASLPPVAVDPADLGRILDNLIDNAIKYGREGGNVSIRARALRRHVQCVISDDGMGIPADELSRVFDRRFRASSVTGTHVGSGLGLSICRRLVHEHGGRIWVRSAVGEGSTFGFTLPIAQE